MRQLLGGVIILILIILVSGFIQANLRQMGVGDKAIDIWVDDMFMALFGVVLFHTLFVCDCRNEK